MVNEIFAHGFMVGRTTDGDVDEENFFFLSFIDWDGKPYRVYIRDEEARELSVLLPMEVSYNG